MKHTALTPKAIIKRLEQAPAITLSLTPDINKEKFQKQLSQAKTRLGVEGKLSFEWAATKEGEEKEVSIVLHPSKNAVVATLKDGL